MADYQSAYTGTQIDAAVARALAMPAFKGEVTNYAGLPGSPSGGDTYVVLNATGIWPFNRRSAGFYRFDGSDWVYLGLDLSSLQTDSNWVLRDESDTTKQLQFQLSGITTATTRTLTVPDASGTISLAGHTHTLSAITDAGTAAASDTGDFATAAQGGKADTAVQPADLATVATSGSYSDLSGAPAIPTALADLTDDSTHRLVTDTEKATWGAMIPQGDVEAFVVCDQATYDGLTPDANTVYFIV